MNLDDIIVRTVDSVLFDEEPEPADDFGGLEPQELDAVLARLSAFSTAVRLLQHQARGRFGDFLGVHGFARFGDRAYRASPDRKVKLRRESEAEWWDHVLSTGLAPRLFNPNVARTTGIREAAEKWVDPETGEVGSHRAFEDRFYDVTEGEVKVSELPVDKAPKFLQKLADGSVERRG